MKVTAVIVTYNRLTLLKLVVDSVLDQTRPPDEVLIVNNNSTDGTESYLDELARLNPLVRPIHLNENTGGAGGFFTGTKLAYERNADWVWLLDDDATPTANALSKLVESDVFEYFQNNQEKTLGFLASRVDWIDGTACKMNVPHVHSNGWLELHHLFPRCVRIKSASFVSVLINRQAIKKVGYPVKEFFIWFDDVEYTQRISRTNGMVAYYLPDSVVIHRTETNMAPTNMSLINRNNLWKYKYGIRNEIAATIRSGDGLTKAMYYFLRIVGETIKQKKIFYLFPVLVAGIQGLFFNYRKSVVFPAD